MQQLFLKTKLYLRPRSLFALPARISSKRTAKRLKNDMIQLRERDNVGLIDGFLRLMSPEKYEIYRKSAESLYYKYEY